jgi:methyltransferase (TIGR00027 family)
LKKDAPSKTAQYNAFFRGLETARPPAKRLFSDPFARHFMDREMLFYLKLSTLPLLGPIIPWYVHQRAFGAISSSIGRTKYIDVLLEKTVKSGIRQLIILGAGFDTRAFRLNFLDKVRVIEVDHPDTSSIKIQTMKQALPTLPNNVSFFQLDFSRQSLEEITGIDFSLATTIIWEGVAHYLNKEAVDKTLDFTKKFAAPFHLIFTYIDRAVLCDPARFAGTKDVGQYLRGAEENWSFGFDPPELATYLAGWGLVLQEDLSADQYRKRYMSERKRISRGFEFYHVAFASRS